MKLLSNFLRQKCSSMQQERFCLQCNNAQHHYLVLLLTPTLSRERILLLEKADTLLAGF